MKIVAAVFFLFVILWVGVLVLLLGTNHTSLLGAIAALKPPESTSDLGESMAILDGLFSSLAVILGLAAIMLQRKDLQSSIRAQHDQAKALSAQMSEQRQSNLLSAYTARLQFLLSETERMSADIDRLICDLNKNHDPQKAAILENTIEKRKAYRQEAQNIDSIINEMLPTTSTGKNTSWQCYEWAKEYKRNHIH